MSRISTAVAAIGESPAAQVITQHSADLASVLPSHMKAMLWESLTKGALKKGKKNDQGKYILEVAALNNPAAFVQALMEAARLGLEPGTDQYYLTVRPIKGRDEILGIVGYQGFVELMYRAGQVGSVVVEPVYTNDTFEYYPGRDEVPNHEIDWDAESRGELRMVYAYARMVSGSTSKVVVLNKAAIERIKKSSPSQHSTYGPWEKHPEPMWMKSAVRQLAKWVPTSAEYIQLGTAAMPAIPAQAAPLKEIQYMEDQVAQEAPEGVHAITGEIVDETPMASNGQLQEIKNTWERKGNPSDGLLSRVSFMINRKITTPFELTATEAVDVIAQLGAEVQS